MAKNEIVITTEQGVKYTITHLLTKNDNVLQIATTKARKWYGPASILLIEYPDGSKEQLLFDLFPGINDYKELLKHRKD